MARYIAALALLTLVVVLTTPLSHADDKLTRPRLENYASYDAFLAAMYAYKKQLELEKKFADSLVIKIDMPETAEATGGAVSSMPIKVPELSPEGGVYVPPLVINGPESLEYAIEAAKRFLHPIYTAKQRYNRTTAQSFPLQPVDALELEEVAVSNGLSLSFSPDNEKKVGDELAAVTRLKVKEAAETDEQEQDINQQALEKTNTLTTPDRFIMGSDFNQVSITVISR